MKPSAKIFNDNFPDDSKVTVPYVDRNELKPKLASVLESAVIPVTGATGDVVVKLEGMKPKVIEVLGDTLNATLVRQSDGTYSGAGNSAAVDNGDDVDVTVDDADVTDGNQGVIRISFN